MQFFFQAQEGQVQKKITPWSQMFDLEQESKKNPCHTDLIMVASLIDRAPNLGGLSRTCEIFGAGKLILNNKKIINDKGGLISEGIFYREWDRRILSQISNMDFRFALVGRLANQGSKGKFLEFC